MNCESWEVELELELETIWNKKVESHLQEQQQKSKCPDCGQELIDGTCPICGKTVGHTTEHYSDPDFDEYFEQIEQENKEFFENKNDVNWEPVPDDEPIPQIEEPLEV